MYAGYQGFAVNREADVRAVKKRVQFSDLVSLKLTTDNNEPFSYYGREYWYHIYDVDWKMLVIMSSRQAEKTSFIAKRATIEMMIHPKTQLLYATATHNHLREFSFEKFRKQFDNKPALKAQYTNSKLQWSEKTYRFTNGSTIRLRSIGLSGQSARGISSDKVYFDETQSILSDSIPIVMETAHHAAEKAAFAFTGTPLLPRNVLSVRYNNSIQNEWIIKCPHCKKDNPPLGEQHIDEKKPYLFCVMCGKEMSAKAAVAPGAPGGRWVPQNPAGDYPGFRICRLMTPTCRWETPGKNGVLDALKAYGTAQFTNEVLGLPAGVGTLPISEEALYKNCAHQPGELYDWIDPQSPPPWLRSVRVVMTIDWAWASQEGASSYTIFALWIYQYNRIKCIYAKRQIGPKYSDPDFSLSEIVQTIANCNVSMVGTDFGIGHKENDRLRGKFTSGKVAIFEFLYTTTDADSPILRSSRDIGRTTSLDNTFSALRAVRFLFPAPLQAKPYLDDILNVYTEVDPNYKKVKYEHAGTGPDDFLHLCNYARLTFQLGAAGLPST